MTHLVYDRALLLNGPKRNEILTLEEVRRYGVDSFSDPDYIRIYGMSPNAWYGLGIRLIGRTAVECTRDELSDRIGRDIARIAGRLPVGTSFTVIDPFLRDLATRSTGFCIICRPRVVSRSNSTSRFPR
jgi:hypothetical protein